MNLDAVAAWRARERDLAAGLGELHGVAQQVEHDLLQLLRIGKHCRSLVGSFAGITQTFRQNLRRDHRFGVLQRFIDGNSSDMVFRLASVDLGEVEHIVDER